MTRRDYERLVRMEHTTDLVRGALTGVVLASVGVTVTAANVWVAEYVAGDQISLLDSVGEGAMIVGVAALAGAGVAAAVRHLSSSRN